MDDLELRISRDRRTMERLERLERRRIARARSVSWSDTLVNIPGVAFRDYDTETAFQIYCLDWIRKQFELYPGNGAFDFWHHSANERDGARAGFIAKMMGQSKGFPDLVHFGLRLALELKLPGRKASLEQLRWLEHFRSLGWHAELVTSFERFRYLVLEKAGP